MKFFTDECFIYKANNLLRAFDGDNEIVALLEYYNGRKKIADTTWIPDIAKWQPKPVVLGGDGRILKNAVEREALRQAGLTFVYLASGWTNTPWRCYAWKLIKYWPDVVDRVAKVNSPKVIEVSVNGKFREYALP